MKKRTTEDLKATLTSVIHGLHAAGWAPATSSNYSFRADASSEIWISASGLDKGKFTETDFMAVDAKSKVLFEDQRKPSAETLLHTLLYELYPSTTCILHTHSVTNTVLSRAHEGEGAITLRGYELQKALAGIESHREAVRIPIFSNSQDMEKLAKEIRKTLAGQPESQAFLLAGHGLYTWAPSIEAAQKQIEALEFLLECVFNLRLYQK